MWKLVARFLYPSWVSVAYFTQGWGIFFSEEVYILSFLLGLVFMWHYFVAGFAWSSVQCHVALVIGFRRLLAGGLCTSTKRLDGLTVIITGANVGIGKETARDMLRRGAHVILACRDVRKAEATRQDLRGEGGRAEVRKLDLSSLQSVRDFASDIVKEDIKVHILINNAGVLMESYSETSDGFEMTMATNHLGHFLLTNLLLPQLQHGQPARIINVSSAGHALGKLNFDDFNFKKNFNGFQAYCNSKLANVLFTRQLAKKLKDSGVLVFSLHPGTVHTQIGRNHGSHITNELARVILKTTMEGAHTTIYCATEAAQHQDMYFSDCAVGWVLDTAKDDALAARLWTHSAQLVGFNK